MRNTIRVMLALVCLALSGGVLADGVPLITAGPPIAAGDPIRQSDEAKAPNFVQFHSIALNKGAFGANVLTVVVEGKEYRFAGTSATLPTARATSATWAGNTGTSNPLGYGVLVLSRGAKGEFFGTLDLPPARHFYFTNRGVMVETDLSKTPFNPTLIAADPPRPLIPAGASK